MESNSFGDTIRKLRHELKLPLRVVAECLKIDQAILSKIELGQRRANRDLVLQLAGYFNQPKNELLKLWLSDKILYEISDEEIGLGAIHSAEEKMGHYSIQKVERTVILEKIKNVLRSFPMIQQAWIFGSFARGEEIDESDIDIAIETDPEFSYFDLAEVQHVLEQEIRKKVDIGFKDSIRPKLLNHISGELISIYAR